MHESIWYNHNCVAKVDEYGEVETVPDSGGFPSNSKDMVKNEVFNDIDAFEHVVKKYKGRLQQLFLSLLALTAVVSRQGKNICSKFMSFATGKI